jgi:hypothetical protein
MTETAVAEKPKRSHHGYTQEEITRALVEVAACSGNSHMAARNLEADESAPNIPQQTLWAWSRRERVEEYERIRQQALPAITQEAAEQHMHLARLQADYARSAAEHIAERIPRMEDKDLVNAMGKFDIGSGIHTEKAQLLAGQPTQIVKREASEVLRKLQSRGIVVDAEVIEEETEESGSQGLAVVASSSQPDS